MPAAVDCTDQPTAALVQGALWVQALPADQLEHVTIRVRPDQIDVTAFLLLVDQPDGRRAVGRIVAAALRSTPQLLGWRVSSGPC